MEINSSSMNVCNMKYSDTGKKLAKTFYETADATSYATNANKVLWDGFDGITTSSETTENEKALARMASKIGSNSLEPQEHNRIAFSIMKAIANQHAGPVGTVIAKVAYDAANKTEKATSANKVLWEGYNTLVANTEVSERDKAIARLGNNIAYNSLEPQEHNRIGFSIMKSISNQIAGPMGTVIANVAYDAADATKLAKSANRVLWAGFDAIIDNQESSDLQKKLAKEASEIASHSMEPQEHNRIAFKMMKSIKES